MASDTTTFPATSGRAFRRILPWALALAVATCTNDQNGPSDGGTGYFSFRPVYGISNSLSQFGIVADSIHIKLTRPVDQLVLDTTVFFPPDSTALRLALPVRLEQSPETLGAVVEIKSGPTILFVDSLDVQVLDGPPTPANIPTIVLDYVGPGKNVAAITILPGDTTMTMGDTLFFTSTAVDSSAQPVASFFTAWKTSDTTVARINAQGRLIAPNLRSSVQVIGYTPTGIADTTTVTFAPVPVIITADSGNAQAGQAGDSLGALFVARVKGADSLGISGIAVRFAAVTAGGAVRDTATLLTDANGRVRTRGVLGTTAGGYTYTATVVGTALTRNFTATATAGAAAAIAIQNGNAQTDSAGRILPVDLTVRVTDAFDNPVAGAKVYWTRVFGNGTVSDDSTVTDILGITNIEYLLGAAGTDSIRAALAGTSATVTFLATSINGAPATVAKTLGDLQADTVGRLLTDSLVVVVQSATSQPVAGTPVVWTVLRGGATSADTAITDASGRAAVAYTLGTVPGTDSVRAQAGGASAVFTATVATGAATTLALVSGDAQTDTTDKTLPLPFVVRATDAFGNNVAGTAIAWSRSFGTGSLANDTVLTDGAGLASNAYTLGGSAGTDTVVASLVCGCSTVTFTATAVSAAPASIVTIGGDSQTVVVNTVADTFQVLVRDGSNNPVAGATVSWAFIPAQGSFQEILPAGIQQTLTDSLGVARGLYTTGTQAGTIRVEAQVGALIDSIYVFAVPATAATIAIQSGDAQSDTVGNAIPLPFVVRVADGFNNPVSGAQVAFTRVAGSGTLFADTLLTDAAGQAAVGYLFGLIPGVDTIRATLVATGDSVRFTATALPATPAGIILVSGDGQSGVVATPLAESLLVHVEDGGGTGVAAAQVVWTVLRGGTLDVDTVL
ncbi:MAG TPA: Ig-like domain-containing protein, partial [Gemmatimonadales bacterium]|nr:Ig-like domain-containing protein [Gemmatimonadales bacterium]